jgi:hypothetical protein
MKIKNILAVLALASFVAGGSLFAADAPVSKPAGCCAKAEAKGEKCSHECCAEAAKAGNNCEKCKGSGKIEKKEEVKK